MLPICFIFRYDIILHVRYAAIDNHADAWHARHAMMFAAFYAAITMIWLLLPPRLYLRALSADAASER